MNPGVDGPLLIRVRTYADRRVHGTRQLARRTLAVRATVIFHRVVPGFVVQGGDPTGTGRGGPGYKSRTSSNNPQSYKRGTVAMANAGPNTNGSQFFICLADVRLPCQYTIFGEVTSGMDAVDAIAKLPRSGEKPTEDAVIEKVTVTQS